MDVPQNITAQEKMKQFPKEYILSVTIAHMLWSFNHLQEECIKVGSSVQLPLTTFPVSTANRGKQMEQQQGFWLTGAKSAMQEPGSTSRGFLGCWHQACWCDAGQSIFPKE